jgi:hypothetical protein
VAKLNKEAGLLIEPTWADQLFIQIRNDANAEAHKTRIDNAKLAIPDGPPADWLGYDKKLRVSGKGG